MNGRIKELVKQAGGIGHDDDSNELTPALVGKSLEKFAKLLVKECCQFMESLPSSTYHVGRSRMSEEIKEHFGVEE